MLDKLRSSLGTIVAIAFLLLIATVGYLYAKGRADEEIARVTAERDYLRAEKETIEALVARNDSLKDELLSARLDILSRVDHLQDIVDSLELLRDEERLTVRKLRRTEDLQKKFVETFPEVASSDWGIHEIYNEEFDISIEYISIPSRFIETFIIQHDEAKNLLAQRDTLQTMANLQRQVNVLSDSVITLETASRTAYQEGYNEAFIVYEDVVDRYVKELEKPQFSFSAANIGLLLGSFAVGVAVAK